MASSESLYVENDLDEEKAKRSILVTNVPGNITNKDVIIHFQRTSNGGGEVDSGVYLDPDRSSVVITFDDPATVETAVNRPQSIEGNEVTVQRYSVKIPEIFSVVDAIVNPDVFGSELLLEVMSHLERDIGITYCESVDRYRISGSYLQITSCHKYILDEISKNKAEPQRSSRSAENDTAEERDETRVTPRSPGQADEVKGIGDKVFQTVPIILQYILTVPKHRDRIQVIMSEFSVEIFGVEDDSKVVIRPLSGCTKAKHDDACEEYINLYIKISDSPMMSKDINLKPGSSSSYSSSEAVNEVMQRTPVAIQKIEESKDRRFEEPDKWLFYGEETAVKSAIKHVCEKLKIDNPFPNRKVIAKNTSSAANSNMAGRKDEGQAETLNQNPTYGRRPLLLSGEDVPAHKELPFEVKTKKGFRLTVRQGDITREPVDVIVNSTDEYPKFLKGLPAAFVRTGGRKIEDEAMTVFTRKKTKPGNIITTGPGTLLCSRINHILTRKYYSDKKRQEECKKCVKDGVFKSLKKTEREKLKSIAFPAVGTGQQFMPLDICATAMINGIEEYMKDNHTRTGAIEDIRFVHFDPYAVEVFKAELTKRYADSIVKPEREDISRRTKYETLPPPDESGGFSSDKKTSRKEEEEDECPICLDKFKNPIALRCNHKFCKSCIDQAFKQRKACPICGMTYGVQTGNMPRGSMNHTLQSYMRLPGYDRWHTIIINYNFPSGTQGPEHPNPGQQYTGTSRTAYLPDCPEGKEVLGLLKKAFDARLTFTIGRSVTTGANDVITWNDIHHKTNQYGGATGFGYPDPTYLKRVKAELASKGIS